jgi:hypothetical protein
MHIEGVGVGWFVLVRYGKSWVCMYVYMYVHCYVFKML